VDAFSVLEEIPASAADAVSQLTTGNCVRQLNQPYFRNNILFSLGSEKAM